MKGILETRVVTIPLRHRFRGVTERHAVLLRGEAGWGEFSPFAEYQPPVTSRWLKAAIEAATHPFPPPRRQSVLVNVTVPEVDPETAARLVTESGCRTAKVKVGSDVSADWNRVGAVRDALGPEGHIRIDVNGGWDVGTARKRIATLSQFGLEYVEQPVASFEEMTELRRHVDVPLAADELVRSGTPPERISEAADLVVIKAQPLGGIEESLSLVERTGLPAVVSSALETSVGLAQGVALAAALPELARACGLGTGLLLGGDVGAEPLLPEQGSITTRRVIPSPDLMARWAATPAVQRTMLLRLEAAYEAMH
jgi:O-succinylbenzoate synthase